MSRIIELEKLNGNQQEEQLDDLLHSLQKDGDKEFEKVLKQGLKNGININHSYPDQGNKTLLDIACSSLNKADHVNILLDNGANANSIGSQGVAPIHLAVLHSDRDTVKVLVDHKDINIELENKAHETAFHLAVKYKRKDLIPLFRKRQAKDIKLKKREILNSINTQTNTDDEIEPFLENINESDMHDGNLFLLLHKRDYASFASKANEHNVKLVDKNQKFTYLQYACKLGSTEVVKHLLGVNVDPNETTESNKQPPIVIAAFYGYHNIVQHLLDAGIIVFEFDGRNVLHYVMNKIYSQKYGEKIEMYNSDESDYRKCLQLFLNSVPHNLLNIDKKDGGGVYPLEYAIYIGERELTLSLLERGAYIGVPGWLKKPVIQYMEADELEYFLEGSMNITKTWNKKGNSTHLVNFNYNWLTCRQEYLKLEYINEMKPLLAISEEPNLRSKLEHPSLLVFLDLKWHIVMSKLYFTNLAFHLQFVVFFSIYLLVFKYEVLKNKKILVSSYAVALWYIIFIGNSIICFKEFTQLIIYSYANKYRYIKDYRNWLELTLIIITYVILFCEMHSIPNKGFLASAAIFLSYVQLILLILSHPILCVRIEMFKKVAFNAFTFLLSYLLLILAFAFSFYILFKDTSTNTTSTNTNTTRTNTNTTSTNTTTTKTSSFNNITQAVFKTLLMSTGEYDLSDILINDEYNITRWVVILFMFLIPIVLFNLLNAIAVGDIQKIRKDAELVSVIARVKLITHMEEMISTLFSFLDKLASYCNRPVGMEFLKYYYTNYFSTTDNRKVRHDTSNHYCTLDENDGKEHDRGESNGDKQDGYKLLKFTISPFTQESIRRACSKEDKKTSSADSIEEKVDPHHTTVEGNQEVATLPEVCNCPETLRSVLERFEERLINIIEQKLTENTKLSNLKVE